MNVAYQATAFFTWFRRNQPMAVNTETPNDTKRTDPERYFAYRWHPYAVDPAVDYSTEPTTLVEFKLEDTDGGTALTIVESGFDRIPLARRAEAFRMNDNGWTGQIKQLAKYVE